jgi:hypothetical protein
MSTIVECAIQALDLPALYPAGGGYIKPVTPSIIEDIMGILRLCFDTRDRIRYIRLLSRLLPPPAGVSTVRHVVMFHAQFLPQLHELLLNQKAELQQELRSTTENFLVAVIKIFANRVMYKELEDRFHIGRIKCSCIDCGALRNSFEDNRSYFFLQRRETIIKHLHSEVLKTKIQCLSGVKVATSCVNKGAFQIQVFGTIFLPPTILTTSQIFRPENLTKRGFWYANSATGTKLMSFLGDLDAQRRVFGDDFDSIRSRITEFGAASGRAPNPGKEIQVALKQFQDMLSTESRSEPVAKRRRLR